MGISMRNQQGKKNRGMHYLVFVIAIIIVFVVVNVLPLEAEWKRFFFFLMLPIAAIAGVFVTNMAKRRK